MNSTNKIGTAFACLLAVCLLAAGISPAFSADKAAPPQKAPSAQAPPPGPAAAPGQAGMPSEDGVFIKFKHVWINKKTKEVTISAKTALAKGILEYLLVGEKGKAYESAFKVEDALPSELNFALILIGCEALPYDEFMKLIQAGKSGEDVEKAHPGSIVTIELKRKGKPVPLSNVIRDRENKKGKLTWVYTGGRFLREAPRNADQPLSFIGVWPDVSAVVNLFSGRGNPYRGNFGFEMNSKMKGLAKDQDYEIVIRRKFK